MLITVRPKPVPLDIAFTVAVLVPVIAVTVVTAPASTEMLLQDTIPVKVLATVAVVVALTGNVVIGAVNVTGVANAFLIIIDLVDVVLQTLFVLMRL